MDNRCLAFRKDAFHIEMDSKKDLEEKEFMVWISSHSQRVWAAVCFAGFLPDTVTNSRK